MAGDMPELLESFESWLLRRVAKAAEAGEVPADLLTELQAEFEAARKKPQKEAHGKALKDIAEKLETPQERAERMLNALEAQPRVTRAVLMRRLAEAWLEGHRAAYRDRGNSSL